MKFRPLALFFALVCAGSVSWSTAARAESCVNDNDCKANGTACGTDVCNYSTGPACAPPSSSNPGWCGTSLDGGVLSQAEQDQQCKCHNLGATCVYPYCTIITSSADSGTTATTDSGAGAATDSGAGAASGSSTGASGSGTGASGSSTATTDSGTGSAPASGSTAYGGGNNSSSGGCNVGSGGSSPWGAGWLALCAFAAVRRRRAS